MGREFWKKYWKEITSREFNKEFVIFLVIVAPFYIPLIILQSQSHINGWASFAITSGVLLLGLLSKGPLRRRFWR